MRAPWVGLGLALCTASWLGLCLYVAAAPSLRPHARLALFVGLWSGGSGLLDVLGAPVQGWSLTAGLALRYPELWPLVAVGGWPLLDAVALGGLAIIWAMADVQRRSLTWAMAVLAWVSALGAAALLPDDVSVAGRARVGVVQSNVEWSAMRNVAVSPADRAMVRHRVLELTHEAIRSGASLVVWPENGMGLPLGQLPLVLDALAEKAARHDVEILTTGSEVRASGRRPAAWLVGDGVLRVVRKRDHVPFLEDPRTQEAALVVAAKEGILGVLICYDAVRSPWVNQVVDGGAELLVSPTDNASYLASTLTDWQRATAALLAAEHGRPLVLVANRGPSVLIDPVGKVVRTLLPRRLAGAALVEVPRVRGRTWADRGGRIAVTLVCLAFGAALLRGSGSVSRGSLTWPRPPARGTLLAGLASLVAWLLGSLGGAVASLQFSRGDLSLSGILEHHRRRWHASAVYDGGSAVFRQSDTQGCGPAALAWSLFGLGDTVYEDELRRRSDKHSLADLADAATSRGFYAVPFVGELDALVSAADTAFILHVGADHFVGCRPRSDGTFAVFDPDSGAVTIVSREDLAARWSGAALLLRLPEPIRGPAR